MIGASTYQLIRNLLAPQKPAEKAFNDLVKLVQKHYQPNRSIIVQCFKFNFHSSELAESYQLYHLQNSQRKPLEITLLVNQKELTMEIGTRAALSLISEKTLH